MNHMLRGYRPGSSGRYWAFSETVTDGTSEPLVVPDSDGIVAVSVTPGTSARVEYSLSSYAGIGADTATWHAWPHGDIADALSDAVDARITALRLVSTGASDWEVTA